MLIVQADEELQLDARVAPADVDQITLGQSVRVKVQAGNQASNPELIGKVSRISADISSDDRLGTPYYTVRVAMPRSELERLAPVQVIAGMQAEAYIETVPRSPLNFLLKPITTQFGRAFIER